MRLRHLRKLTLQRPSRQAVPARRGAEALAVAFRQPLELGIDIGHAARADVMHGSAAERRGGGGGDHGGVGPGLVRGPAPPPAGGAGGGGGGGGGGGPPPRPRW